MKKQRLWLLFFLLILAFAGTMLLRAQEQALLRPPKGAKIALVVFEDMECPQCAHVHPLLEQAARTYRIPLVQRDFTLPYHTWSMEAALMARYFDTKSPKLGKEFRSQVFAHQTEITKDNLRPFADKFAAEHQVELPMFVDPQGKFAAQIEADKELGTRIGITHTPTVYIVSSQQPRTPFVEVTDLSKLYQMLDAARRGRLATGATPPAFVPSR